MGITLLVVTLAVGIGQLSFSATDFRPADAPEPRQERTGQAPVTVTCGGSDDGAALLGAVKSAGVKMVLISAGQVCAGGDIDIPNLRIEKGGMLKPTNGKTITLSESLEAGPYQIFANALEGQGTVSLSRIKSLKEVYPEWWGAVDGAAANVQMSAFQRAVDTGKRVFLAGQYVLDNSSGALMLNNGTTQVAVLQGAGMEVSLIKFTSNSKPGITIDYPHRGVPSAVLRDFAIRGAASAQPQYVAGGYGIFLPGYHDRAEHVISNLLIENVKLDQFGDNAIRLQGATGPVSLRNVVISDIGDYGIKVTADAKERPECPQDVTIDGGSIHATRGGISIDGGTSMVGSLTVRDVDIELRTAQTKPTLYLKNTYGGMYSGLTVSSSTSKLEVGDANIYLDAGASGNSFAGFYNYASGGLNNIHDYGTNTGNTFTGGFAVNSASPPAGLGYLAKVTGAVNDVFMNLFWAPSTFAADHDLIKAGPPNSVVVFGVKTSAR